MSETQTANTQKPRIRVGKYRDGYYYLWINGKRYPSTAYGDKTAAQMAAEKLRGRTK
ncbi:MAG TPA: hypothetical protein VFA10_27355 [Ktedonobacteraceae bacterium]|nr:hypothetical protein [Ktedonobacteraceae bacterium]